MLTLQSNCCLKWHLTTQFVYPWLLLLHSFLDRCFVAKPRKYSVIIGPSNVYKPLLNYYLVDIISIGHRLRLPATYWVDNQLLSARGWHGMCPRSVEVTDTNISMCYSVVIYSVAIYFTYCGTLLFKQTKQLRYNIFNWRHTVGRSWSRTPDQGRDCISHITRFTCTNRFSICPTSIV